MIFLKAKTIKLFLLTKNEQLPVGSHQFQIIGDTLEASKSSKVKRSL